MRFLEAQKLRNNRQATTDSLAGQRDIAIQMLAAKLGAPSTTPQEIAAARTESLKRLAPDSIDELAEALSKTVTQPANMPDAQTKQAQILAGFFFKEYPPVQFDEIDSKLEDFEQNTIPRIKRNLSDQHGAPHLHTRTLEQMRQEVRIAAHMQDLSSKQEQVQTRVENAIQTIKTREGALGQRLMELTRIIDGLQKEQKGEAERPPGMNINLLKPLITSQLLKAGYTEASLMKCGYYQSPETAETLLAQIKSQGNESWLQHLVQFAGQEVDRAEERDILSGYQNTANSLKMGTRSLENIQNNELLKPRKTPKTAEEFKTLDSLDEEITQHLASTKPSSNQASFTQNDQLNQLHEMATAANKGEGFPKPNEQILALYPKLNSAIDALNQELKAIPDLYAAEALEIADPRFQNHLSEEFNRRAANIRKQFSEISSIVGSSVDKNLIASKNSQWQKDADAFCKGYDGKVVYGPASSYQPSSTGFAKSQLAGVQDSKTGKIIIVTNKNGKEFIPTANDFAEAMKHFKQQHPNSVTEHRYDHSVLQRIQSKLIEMVAPSQTKGKLKPHSDFSQRAGHTFSPKNWFSPEQFSRYEFSGLQEKHNFVETLKQVTLANASGGELRPPPSAGVKERQKNQEEPASVKGGPSPTTPSS